MGAVRITRDSLDTLIARVCPGVWKSSTSGKLQVTRVNDLSLRVLLFNITRVASSQAQHEATKTQLRLTLDCLNPTMFDWVEAVSLNMKRQLTRCQRGETNQFGYGSILVLLMVKQVLILQLQDMQVGWPRP